MFEHRPISLDATTAGRVVDELVDGSFEGLMQIFADAAAAGRMPDRPGTRVGTYLWSDLLVVDEEYEAAMAEDGVGTEPAPRIRELMDEGLSRPVAEALGTCELALSVADTGSAASLAVLASHAGYNLTATEVLAAARTHCTPPGSAPGWRAIAACLQEPQRSACLDLARTAEAAAA